MYRTGIGRDLGDGHHFQAKSKNATYDKSDSPLPAMLAISLHSLVTAGMALSSITDALTQYNANIPWHTSQATAALALEAVQYLLINRAQKFGDHGSELNYESLAQEKSDLQKFLGATAPQAFGRSRRVGARFGRAVIQ